MTNIDRMERKNPAKNRIRGRTYQQKSAIFKCGERIGKQETKYLKP